MADVSKTTITEAATFCRWWQMRNLPNDRAVLKAAVQAGLISCGGGMISLTLAGHELRQGLATVSCNLPESMRISST